VPEHETSQQDDSGSLNDKEECENNMEVKVVDEDMVEDEKSTETMIVSQPTTPRVKILFSITSFKITSIMVKTNKLLAAFSIRKFRKPNYSYLKLLLALL
jgi:hypothetical protein